MPALPKADDDGVLHLMLSEAMNRDMNKPMRPLKRFKVRFCGQYLEYAGKTVWNSKYSAKEAIRRAMREVTYTGTLKDQFDYSYVATEHFIEQLIKDGQIELVPVQA